MVSALVNHLRAQRRAFAASVQPALSMASADVPVRASPAWFRR